MFGIGFYTTLYRNTNTMPIYFDLESVRSQNNCVNYFETGTFDARHNIACKQAIDCGFTKVYTLDIVPEFGKFILPTYYTQRVATGSVVCITDDAVNIGAHLGGADFAERTLFYLDSYNSETDTPYPTAKHCPVLEELNGIAGAARKDHVICINDVKTLRQPYPYGETSYGDINFEERAKEIILTINPAYQFSYLQGEVADDVLMATVPDA